MGGDYPVDKAPLPWEKGILANATTLGPPSGGGIESGGEVNPEMIAAGVGVLNSHAAAEKPHFYPDEYTVELIFMTMFRQMKRPLDQI